ncbi:MAG: protein translocase subunit SecD [bacterium]|nr:protein translocase subunit SecD [bacterium]
MQVATQKILNPKKARIFALVFLFLGIILGFFADPAEILSTKLNLTFLDKIYAKFPYRLGLDIQGGTHLVYQADLTNTPGNPSDSMEAVRDVIERRVNLFGVAEPVVQVEKSGSDWRLIVELAGVKDINAAINMIGETPFLEFKEERSKEESDKILEAQKKQEIRQLADEDPYFLSTSLTGKHIKNAQVNFDQNTYQPQISLELTDEGSKLFQEISKKNIGKRLAIYLDGVPISAPVVQEEITGGKAQITGTFTPVEAKQLVGRLNSGALPVPIKLISQESLGPSLGQESLAKSLQAGIFGFLAIALFMILWYRIPGFISVLALLIYTSIVLTIFKLIPVTLTMAGIAGFILSIGMAVDANVLIFERMKEELRGGRNRGDAIMEGFRRAWTSIRDSNVSSLITCAILYWFGTSIIKGFALTLAIGIVISMFSAISLTRIFLVAAKFRD